ncbi:MAG TPA: methyltransferase domain-containing protein [Pseudomonadales bacterium]
MNNDYLDWSLMYENRRATQRTFGDIWDLPIQKRHHKVIALHGKPGLSWLEIGAGDRRLKQELETQWPLKSYKSFDIDQRHPHDFFSLHDIEGKYDRICMFEMIEHITIEHAKDVLSKCRESLVPGGKLLITTPNIYYPPGFLRDASHITPWAYDELGGLVRSADFEVIAIYRLYNDAFLRKIAHRYLLAPLHRFMGIDFSKQIMLVAELKQA